MENFLSKLRLLRVIKSRTRALFGVGLSVIKHARMFASHFEFRFFFLYTMLILTRFKKERKDIEAHVETGSGYLSSFKHGRNISDETYQCYMGDLIGVLFGSRLHLSNDSSVKCLSHQINSWSWRLLWSYIVSALLFQTKSLTGCKGRRRVGNDRSTEVFRVNPTTALLFTSF